MGVTEAHDGGVVDVISRTMVPIAVPRIRTELHHPERYRRSRISVPVTSRPNEYIHELRESAAGRCFNQALNDRRMPASWRSPGKTGKCSRLQERPSTKLSEHY